MQSCMTLDDSLPGFEPHVLRRNVRVGPQPPVRHHRHPFEQYAWDGSRAAVPHQSYGATEVPAILKDTDPYWFVVFSTVRVPWIQTGFQKETGTR